MIFGRDDLRAENVRLIRDLLSDSDTVYLSRSRPSSLTSSGLTLGAGPSHLNAPDIKFR